MVSKPTTVERAFELARSGTCKSVEEIRKTLRAEGFEAPESYLRGRSIGDQLRALIKEAR
jgi:hypothetical protein